MSIAKLCRRRVVTVDRTASLGEAAALMREEHVGALVVVGPSADGPQVHGIVTDRDLVIGVLARGANGQDLAVGDLASEPAARVPQSHDIGQAITVMAEAGVRRLLVTDDEHRLVGVVSMDDLLVACVEQLSGLTQAMRHGFEIEAAAVAVRADPVVRVPAMGTAGWGAVA
jgi:CBS domain-containing protein